MMRSSVLHPGSLLVISVCVGGGKCTGVYADGEALVKETILNYYCIDYCNTSNDQTTGGKFCSYSSTDMHII